MSSRRLEHLAEIDGEGFLSCFLEIANEGVADATIAQRVNVQADDAFDVDMVTQLSD